MAETRFNTGDHLEANPEIITQANLDAIEAARSTDRQGSVHATYAELCTTLKIPNAARTSVGRCKFILGELKAAIRRFLDIKKKGIVVGSRVVKERQAFVVEAITKEGRLRLVGHHRAETPLDFHKARKPAART